MNLDFTQDEIDYLIEALEHKINYEKQRMLTTEYSSQEAYDFDESCLQDEQALLLKVGGGE